MEIDKNLALTEAHKMLNTKYSNEIPALAKEYKNYLCNKVGGCLEVILTAFAHYNQAVLKMSCEDESYKIDADGVQWFSNNYTPEKSVMEIAAMEYLSRVADGKRTTGYCDEDFIEGAKWQEQQSTSMVQGYLNATLTSVEMIKKMYSEEDVITLMQYCIGSPEMTGFSSISKETAKYYLDEFNAQR